MSVIQRLTAFLQSPRGQRMVARGRQELAKPENQAKLRQLAGRFTNRRR
ncbi:hypothetical protein ACFFWC_15005 [Plantactinospora siamensis]|uniref:Uncharacterized protein n=1 Tax=Plantactinospora siamensis TaxID=555372 RepID=A0ABV6P103_9ACTN